jgi:hypothetical protein
MKKAVLLVALAVSSVAAHSEDLYYSLASCQSFSSPVEYIQRLAVSMRPTRASDGVAYFRPRAGLTFRGIDVVSLYAFGPGIMGATPGYGVVIQGTEAYAHGIISPQSRLRISPSLVKGTDYEFTEIGCVF